MPTTRPVRTEKKMNDDIRCPKVYLPLDSRCVLESGHSGKHLFPNAAWKKEDPESWQVARNSLFSWTKSDFKPTDLDSLGDDNPPRALEEK